MTQFERSFKKNFEILRHVCADKGVYGFSSGNIVVDSKEY